MRKLFHANSLICFLATFVCIRAGEISSGLFSKLQKSGEADAILELPSTFEKIQSTLPLSRLSEQDKTSLMINLLQRSAQQAQAPFVQEISRLGLADAASQLWITNEIGINGLNLSSALALAALPGDFLLREPVMVSAFMEEEDDVHVMQGTVQWGVKKIHAPQVWASGIRGEGVVVAGIDTGVYKDHTSLKDNYDGRWFDPVYGTHEPTDRNGHGTHTMSIAVGREHGVGVAPDATWIACRGLNTQGSGTETWVKSCGQWVLQQRPNVVINSWGGGQGLTFYNGVIRAWRAAGIIPVFSIGNQGSGGCGTSNSPGDQPGVISVGSTMSNDSISAFSSKGYSIQGRLKPEISAPGSNIFAAYHRHPTDYTILSGTSMACPHVAGAVALMLSAKPSLSFDQVLRALTHNADHPTLGSGDLACGKNSTANYPNNVYGYGRINVRRAMGF